MIHSRLSVRRCAGCAFVLYHYASTVFLLMIFHSRSRLRRTRGLRSIAHTTTQNPLHMLIPTQIYSQNDTTTTQENMAHIDAASEGDTIYSNPSIKTTATAYRSDSDDKFASTAALSAFHKLNTFVTDCGLAAPGVSSQHPRRLRPLPSCSPGAT